MPRTGQMGRRRFPSQLTKTHDERRATEPLMLSLYGRGCEDGKESGNRLKVLEKSFASYFGVKLI
jgi:hypothetical protein